ncbi:PPR4 [Symbiodinium natans]|uniref:PPR4 protein n=1 Tax=Symbiodinium natans TaxID=878477 RepID=A0A812I4D3_9DINO|nr:PPR4 [Symbiodinium natans]
MVPRGHLAHVLSELCSRGLPPQPASSGAAVACCKAAGTGWQRAVLLLHSARRLWPLQTLKAAICSSLAAHGLSSWRAAEALLRQLGQSGGILNIVHFNSLLDTLSDGGLWANALNQVRKCDATPDAVTFNTLIHASSGKFWQLSRSLLQTMTGARLVCTVKSYGALAAGLETLRFWQHAVDLLQSMHCKTLEMNTIVKGSVAGVLESVSWQRAAVLAGDTMQLHRKMITATVRNWEGSLRVLSIFEHRSIRQDACMWASASERSWSLALSISQACQWHGLSLNTMATGMLVRPLRDAHSWQEASHLLQLTEEQYLQANLVTRGLLTSACSSSHCWSASIQVLDAARAAAILLDTHIHNMAAGGAAKKGDWEASCEIIRALWPRRLQADELTPASVFSGVVSQHRWQRGLQLLAELQPTKPLANAARALALDLCAEAAKWKLAVAWLSAAAQPPAEAFAAALAALAGTGKVLQAYGLLVSLRNQMLRLEPLHLTHALAVARDGQPWASSLKVLRFGQLIGLCLHQGAWHAGVDACGSWKHAMLILASAQSSDVEPDATSVATAIGRASTRSATTTLNLLHQLQHIQLSRISEDRNWLQY